MSDYLEPDYSAGVLPGTTGQADPWLPGVAGSSGVSLGTGTGQQGSVPVGDGGSMSNIITPVVDFLDKPFSTPLNKMDVFWIVGTVAVAIVIWNLILFHIRIAAESI